jgi:hypothetical protein
MAGRRGTAQRNVCFGQLLCAGLLYFIFRSALALALVDLARIRRHRRNRLGLDYILPVSTLIRWFPGAPARPAIYEDAEI